ESRPMEKHGVSIGLGTRHRFGAEIAAGARAVFNDHLYFPDFRESIGDDASDRIDTRSRWKRDDDTHETCGVRLRTQDACRHRERRWGCSEFQCPSTCKVHLDISRAHVTPDGIVRHYGEQMSLKLLSLSTIDRSDSTTGSGCV